MGELALSISLVAVTSLVGSVPWIAGVIIAWLAYRRRRSLELRLALAAFAALVVLQVFGSVVFVFLPLVLSELGPRSGALALTSGAVSILFQLGRSGLIVILAIAFSRLLKESHAAVAHH